MSVSDNPPRHQVDAGAASERPWREDEKESVERSRDSSRSRVTVEMGRVGGRAEQDVRRQYRIRVERMIMVIVLKRSTWSSI